MKHIKALGLLGSSIVIISMLSACQSTPNTPNQPQAKHGHMHGMKHRAMTEEQRQQWQQQRVQACSGKSVGERIEFQQGQRTKVGQCQVRFQLDDKSKSLLQQTLTATERLSREAFHQMSVEQREQIKQQRLAKRTERQALRDQFQAACQGQSAGQNVQIQYNKQQLTGQCVLQYQADNTKTLRRG
jgi:hypothetical protein